MLPGLDGLEVCKRLRAAGDVAILMLTAKDDVRDRVEGLEAGADDYLVKPFSIDELIARIRALLRRATTASRPEILALRGSCAGYRYAPRLSRRARHRLDSEGIRAARIVHANPRQVLTRDVIFDRVWGYDFGGESNIIEVYVRYLRQKSEQEGEDRLIHTVRGVGYVMREE